MASASRGPALGQIERVFVDGSVAGLSDGQLIARFLERHDADAFSALVARHGPLVLGVCRAMLHDANDVEDAFQATFLLLVRRVRTIRNRDVLGGWLHKVAHRVALRARSASAERREHERRAAQMAAISSTHDAPNTGELRPVLHEEIARLPERYRLPIVLCELEGIPQAQAAHNLRWSERTLRRRLAEARERLKRRLDRRGLAPAGAFFIALAPRETAAAVPTAWSDALGQAAAGVLKGSAAAATFSPAAEKLSREVLKMMTARKLIMMSGSLLGVVLTTLAAAAALATRGDEPAAKPIAQTKSTNPTKKEDPQRASESLGRASLGGRVVDPDGKPVANARVWTDWFDMKSRSQKLLAETRTDAQGRFRLGPVEPIYRHRLDIYIEAPGFARQYCPESSESVFPGQDSELGTFELARGRVYTGQVIDHDGTPLPNATVETYVQRHILGHTVTRIGPVHTLTTDREGRFRTPPLPVGLLALVARAPERELAAVAKVVAPGGEEDVGPIRLKKDVPIPGVVKDEDGKPIAGVFLGGVVGHDTTSDSEGRFVIHGFGANPTFQLNAGKDGYAPILAIVRGTNAGLMLHVARGASDSNKPVPGKELAVTLRRAGWIEGQATDADTGKPVALEKVVICYFERKPGGEIVLRGCRSDAFEQPEPGQFRVSYPTTDEYHLSFTAKGYHDAEAFIPKMDSLKTISGIVARMKRKADGSAPTVAQQRITGAVTRDGRPVNHGWAALWEIRKPRNAVNWPVMRGRTVAPPPIPFASAPIRDGHYELEAPFQNKGWYVVIEEAGYPLTQAGPIALELNEKRTLDIAGQRGGSISGRVTNVPKGWEGNLWVVAFTRTGIQAEARVNADSTFALSSLPSGEYGLKVGHDGFEEAEVYPGELAKQHREAYNQPADPWKRAKIVKVEIDRETKGVELELPHE